MRNLAIMLTLAATVATDCGLAAERLAHVPQQSPRQTVMQVVEADRAQFPVTDWPHLRWLSTAHLTREQAADCRVALHLMVCSSSLQPIIERSIPVAVTPEVSRIDLRDLQWAREDWLDVVKDYPYAEISDPAIIRADWLVVKLSDAVESDAYYRLLFGGKNIPATRDEWLKLLDVSTVPGLDGKFRNYGLVEGESGVAVNKIRWIESRPIGRGYAWGTRDTLKVETANDPLEQIDGNYKHDGEEWIVGIEKVSLATGRRGAMQVYLLAAGDGKRVDRAPVDLVEDSTRFRGLREIRNPGSCIQCHDTGLNDFTTNEFRRTITLGVEPYVKDKQLGQQVEAFHLADLARDVDRANEDFATAIGWACGVSPTEAVAAFRRCVNAYDAPVDLAASARELYAPGRSWQLAIAAASSKHRLGARLAGLAHEQTIPREAWEDRYLEARQYWREWRSE